jgi:hypothetical protein
MAAVCFHATLTTATPVPVRAGQTANLKGLAVVNVGVATNFLKLYWVNGVEPPVVGTTVPNLTVSLAFGAAAGVGTLQSFPDGMTGNGQLWVAATGGTGLDTDAGAPSAAIVVSLLVE